MDGMSYRRGFRDLPGGRLQRFGATVTAAAVILAFFVGMVCLAVLLSSLGWAPPDIELLGC